MSSSLAKVGVSSPLLERGQPLFIDVKTARGVVRANPGLLPCPCKYGRVDQGLYTLRHRLWFPGVDFRNLTVKRRAQLSAASA